MSEDIRKVIDEIKLGKYQPPVNNINLDYKINEEPSFLSETMKKASETNAYKKYFYNREDVIEEAKEIHKVIGIPINAILSGNVEKAREIYDYHKKQMDVEETFGAYPGLGKLAQMDEDDAAIALHNMENVKMVHGAFEAAKIGLKSDSLDAERKSLGYDKFMGKTVDEDKLKEVVKELDGLKEIPDLLDAPVESIVGGVAQQVPMLARNLFKGQAYGAIGAAAGFMFGAVGGGVLTGGSASPAFGVQGARIGYSLGSRIGFATEMFKESVGGYYLDYIGYKDKNGNQLLSDNEARNYAAITALAETGIEMANFGKVLDILKGNSATVPAAKIIENIVKNAKDNASVQAQLKTWLRDNMKNAGFIALSESAEEGLQEMSSMTITKVAQTLNPDGDIPVYSAGDIIGGGVRAAYQALPASIGFGALGVGASGMRFTRQAAQLMTIGKERADEALRTHTGIELVNKLMEAAKTTKLGKDHKGTYNKLMKANLEGTAHETAYVDTELLMQEEGGEVVLNQLAAVAGVTEEQLKAYKETGAPIAVNTADYVSTMAEQSQINLNDYISFDAADRCLARNQKVAEEWKKLQNQVNTGEVERLIDNINTLTTEMFGETEERDYANQIISKYEDPYAGIEEQRKQINLEIDEMIVPVVEQMRKGMVHASELHDTNDYWYNKYLKENKKAPSEAKLRKLAEEAITGNNPYGIGDFDYSDPDMEAYAEENKVKIDRLRHELELLKNIRAKLKNVDKGEFAALDALTQEGVKVYKQVADLFRTYGNKADKRAASMNGLIYAHMADRFAAAKRAMGDKEYTALDFLKANPIVFGGETEQGALGQPVTNPLITLDTKVTVVEANREFEGRNYQEIRKNFWNEPNVNSRSLLTDAENKGVHKVVVNKLSGAKITISKNAIRHTLSDHTSKTEKDPIKAKLRKTIEQYELPLLVPRILKEGILVEEHNDINGKVLRMYRLFCPIRLNDGTLVVAKITVERDGITRYVLNDNTRTEFRFADASLAKEKELSHHPQDFGNPNNLEGRTLSSSELTIAQILKDVKDNDGVPYIDNNGNLNVNFVENTNTFNQKQRQERKGQAVIKDNGEKVIRLFENADESTFIHEMGHIAYENLRELASQENAPAQFKRDIKTLDNWANWKEGQIDEYLGTASYQEFAARDAAIKEALANGNTALADQLKYEWRQERFARGWEEYFKKGKAPTEGLRKVFYQFKKWLTRIYRAYKSIGGVPTKEVEDVMKRMLLTDEAIELAEKKAELEAFEKSGVFDYLGNDNAKSMWQKILEEIRAEASAKVLKIAMEDMTKKAKAEREEKIKAEREATLQRMEKEPLWCVYSTLEKNPEANISAICKAFNLTVKEYRDGLRASGGTFDRAVERYMETYIAELEMPNEQAIEARAEEAVNTSYYKQLLDAFELELLQRKVRQEARLSKKLAGIVAETEEERAAQEKALRELDKKAEEARSQRALRDVAVGNAETIREYARQKMATMPIEYSANPTVWKNASRQKAAEMTRALAKKEYGKAVQAAKWRLVYDGMTDIATENKRYVERKAKQMRDRAKTVRREKNMTADDRYVYFHLLYAFGLTERDVPVPPEYKGFEATVIAYKKSHDYGLENMSVQFVTNEGGLAMSDFIINAGTGDAKYGKGISELTASQFKELVDLMDNFYTVAVESNKIKTVTAEDGKTITIEEAVGEMEKSIAERRKEPEVKDTTRAGNIHTWDKILDARNKAHLTLIKAETLLEEMGPAFIKYIYEPIKHASDAELKMTVEFEKKIKAIKQAWYDGKVEKYINQGMTEAQARQAADKEFSELYTDEKYKLGTSTLTKENIIAFALNWGTEANRNRALNYPGTTKAAFERIFAELDGADWQFIVNVWELFEETWPQLKEVEARVSGVTLEKQEGITFNITGKDGATYVIQGKYYPIKYDPNKTAKAETYQKEEGLRSKLPSMARMGTGIGMTKERAKKTNYLIRNDLGVFGEALTENIHLICMREAVRDVSRILNDAQFVELAERYMGKNVAPMLQEWALDCWQVEPKIKNQFEQAMAYVRTRQTMAVLGFRLSTALLNAANYGPMSHYLGVGRTWEAIWNFYANDKDQYNFVMERSPFMKNRARTMDRDMRDLIKEKNGKLNWLEKNAFAMLTQTDLALANPLWLSEYQRVYQENIEKGLPADTIERMAVDAGDKAVRSVFGSGLTQDLAAVQKGGELTKTLTMYYSYFNVVYQAISRAYYETRRRTINKDEWFKRCIPALNLIWRWLILPSVIAAGIKMLSDWATGDDDDELSLENLLLKTGAETVNAATGTIPILRDFTSMAMTYIVDGKYYGARPTPIGLVTENMMDVIRSIKGYAEDKKDVDDVARAVLRSVAYGTGLPVAGADGIATIMQWIEYGDATPEEIREYITAILLDKRVKK